MIKGGINLYHFDKNLNEFFKESSFFKSIQPDNNRDDES